MSESEFFKKSMRLAAIVTAIIGIPTLFVYLLNLAFSIQWCVADEKHCVREWISATSGWAAAIVAILATAATLLPLRQQVAEARNQTRFLLGGNPPTIDLMELVDVEGANICVRVVNWNRRAISLSELAVIHIAESAIGMMEYQHEGFAGETSKFQQKIIQGRTWDKTCFFFKPPIHLKGWEDRSKGPISAQFLLLAANAEKSIENGFITVEAIHVFGRSASNSNRVYKLTTTSEMYEG